LKDFFHWSGTWVTNSPELTIRKKENKTCHCQGTASLDMRLGRNYAGSWPAFHHSELLFSHILASPRPRITPALWMKQAGSWQPGCKSFSANKDHDLFHP